ncbi:MAG TPA: hypothetical protein VLM79_33045, partial [Kofleriaceae bacterium]|nr:hypothetical protein [Kofleriaceae bacterium]
LVATGIAVLLAIVLMMDVGRSPGSADRSLVAGLDTERVTELVWERPGQPAVEVIRAGGAWQIRRPSGAPADAGTVGDVLAALRGARWHRRGAATAVHATLTVVSGSERRTLGIGEPIAGTDQSWIVDGDRGWVVDTWVARALDRDLLSLRIRAPLADVRRAQAIVIEDARGALRIEGRPRRLVRPIALLLAPEPIGELERALDELTIVRALARAAGAHGVAISIAGGGVPATSPITVEIGGSCPGAAQLVAISGSAGDGCVDPAAAAAIDRAVAALYQPPASIVERRPIPFEAQRIVLVDGVAVDLAPLRVGDHAADPARVAELLAALAAPAEVVTSPPRTGADPSTRAAVRQLVVTDRSGGATVLDLLSDRLVARHGEPVPLRLAPGAWSLLARPSRELRDATLWIEEPTMVTSVRIDRVVYQRGAVIGEWGRQPAGAADGTALEALVAAVAAPRALGFLDAAPPIVRRLTIATAPPVGRPREHVLELGAPGAAGCPARADGEAVLLPTAVCARVAALAR